VRLLLLIYLIAVPAAALAGSVKLEAGRAALESRCHRCHAIGLDDASAHPEAPPLREAIRHYAPENIAEALAEGIVSGHPDMPEFVMDPDEIDAVVVYLNSLIRPSDTR